MVLILNELNRRRRATVEVDRRMAIGNTKVFFVIVFLHGRIGGKTKTLTISGKRERKQAASEEKEQEEGRR